MLGAPPSRCDTRAEARSITTTKGPKYAENQQGCSHQQSRLSALSRAMFLGTTSAYDHVNEADDKQKRGSETSAVKPAKITGCRWNQG